MARDPIPTYTYAIVVVRLGHRFLVVQEAQKGQGWYLPAGRVEPGESILDAARRETLEETGIPVAIEGILRFEHTPRPGGTARLRVVFVARPVDDTQPRQNAGGESLGAGWVTLEDLARLELRHPEVMELFQYVTDGAPVYPLELLGREGEPLPARRRSLP